MGIYTPEQERIYAEARRVLFTDFNKFCLEAVRIKPRDGGALMPFKLRLAQKRLHRFNMEQMRERRFVKTLVPKARQLGISTYVQAVDFWLSLSASNFGSYTLAHLDEVSTEIHEAYKKMYANAYRLQKEGHLPPAMIPTLDKDNKKGLSFAGIGSRKTIGTAGSTEIGRGFNLNLVHGSEVALWENEVNIINGLTNAVSAKDGYWFIFESSGQPGGGFKSMCEQAAIEPDGEWRLFFLPFHHDPDYRREVKGGFVFPKAFLDLQAEFKLDREQLNYFYLKNKTVCLMDEVGFDDIHPGNLREYPMVLSHCFMADTKNAFYDPRIVLKSMMTPPNPAFLARGFVRVLGIDVASGEGGADSTFMADRCGPVVGSRVFRTPKGKNMDMIYDVVDTIVDNNIDIVVVDATHGSIGEWFYVSLREKLALRSRARVVPFSFTVKSRFPKVFSNKRAEILGMVKTALLNADAPLNLPNDSTLQAEIAAFRWGSGEVRKDDKNIVTMTPKQKIRDDYLSSKSPDRLDAVALTFGEDERYLQSIVDERRREEIKVSALSGQPEDRWR